MKPRPKLLLLLSVLSALGLVALIAAQTANALGHVERAGNDKADTLERSIVSAVRAVAKYGRDKVERIGAVLDEIAKDPQVVSITLLDEHDAVLLAAGAPPTSDDGRAGAPPMVERTAAFEIDSLCHAGCGGQMGELPSGRYRIVVKLDPSSTAEVRSAILLGAGVVGALFVLAAVFAGLLVRSIRHRERLVRSMELGRQRTESLESLRLLATGLAHEIKNPLGAIRGFAQLIHEQCPEANGEGRERTSLMLRELDRVSERLEEFLAFARRRAIKRRPVDLRRLAEEVATLLGPDAKTAGIGLSVEAEAEEVIVAGDASQLKELLMNLVLNAIEACSDGGRVVVEVAAVRGQPEIRVRDDGRGVAPDDLPRVFEPYFTTRAQGSGLGLAISKRIAEAHGASLELTSQGGAGATATLSFPMAA